MVGMRPFGLGARYSGVSTTPNGRLPFATWPPGPITALAGMSSKSTPHSASVHSTFCVRLEVSLPQSFSMIAIRIPSLT